MSQDVTLTLSRDEALVFFEWLARFNSEEGRQFEDQAEERVLWNLEASLELRLVEPFAPDYQQILEGARARVRDSTT
jgi:hypothetical protein